MKRIFLSAMCLVCFLPTSAQTDINAKYDQALEYANSDSIELAIEIWNNILIDKPDDYKALRNLIIAYTNQDDFRLAREMVNQAQFIYPDSLELYCQLADLYRRRGKWRKAAEACEKCNHEHAKADALIYGSYAFPMIFGYTRKFNEIHDLAWGGDKTAIAYLNDMHLVECTNQKNWRTFPCGHTYRLLDYMEPYLDSREERKTVLHEYIPEFTFDSGDHGGGVTSLDYLVFNVAILSEIACSMTSNQAFSDASANEVSVLLKRVESLLENLDESDFLVARKLPITKSEFLSYFAEVKGFFGENETLKD